MNISKLECWLKKILPFLITILPALFKIAYGREYYSLIDGAIVAALWVVVICLLLDDKKNLFYMKLFLAMISIAAIFFVYIFAMVICLPFISQFLPREDTYIGFSIIIMGVFFCCSLFLWTFRNEAKECEKHYRLIADLMTVIIPIVVLYKIYYGVSDLVKILFLNEGFIGLPVIIYIVRFLVSAYALHDDNNNESLSNLK